MHMIEYEPWDWQSTLSQYYMSWPKTKVNGKMRISMESELSIPLHYQCKFDTPVRNPVEEKKKVF